MPERRYEVSGYESFHGNEFVSDEDAFGYAFERCTNGTDEEVNEFQKMLVDWFFSGNWVRRERNVEE